jgi:hypothetical protein
VASVSAIFGLTSVSKKIVVTFLLRASAATSATRCGVGSLSGDRPLIGTWVRLYRAARYPNAAWLVTISRRWQVSRPVLNSVSRVVSSARSAAARSR